VDEGEDLQLGFTTDPFFCGEATKPPTDVSPKAEEKKAENHFDEAVFDLSCQNVFCNFS